MCPDHAQPLLERVGALYERAFTECPEGRGFLERHGIHDAGHYARLTIQDLKKTPCPVPPAGERCLFQPGGVGIV